MRYRNHSVRSHACTLRMFRARILAGTDRTDGEWNVSYSACRPDRIARIVRGSNERNTEDPFSDRPKSLSTVDDRLDPHEPDDPLSTISRTAQREPSDCRWLPQRTDVVAALVAVSASVGLVLWQNKLNIGVFSIMMRAMMAERLPVLQR